MKVISDSKLVNAESIRSEFGPGDVRRTMTSTGDHPVTGRSLQ